jgi:hypothetical protein
MFCKNCGAQNADGQKFCSSCGTPIDQPQQQFNNNQQQFNNQQYGGQQYGGQPQYNQQYGGQAQYNQYAQPNPNAFYPTPPIQNRNIALAVVFSIITCGIYLYYWLYCLTEDTNKLSNDPNATSGGMVILFTIITCGIYGWYWMYKRGEIIDNYNMQRGLPSSSNAVLYLILSVVGLGIVSYCLMQNELNKLSSF